VGGIEAHGVSGGDGPHGVTHDTPCTHGTPSFSTNAVAPVGSRIMFNGSPHDVPDVVHVLAFELISDRFPLLKSMANELTLLPSVSTYSSPEGREEELPQLSRNKLRAHTPTSATTKPNFFDICSPKGSPIGAFFAD